MAGGISDTSAGATRLAELAGQLARGDAALYLTQSSSEQITGVRVAAAAVDWLAVWSELTDPAFADALAEKGSERSRSLVEVTGRLQDSVGTHYSLGDVCPYFYLAGKGGEWGELPERERRRARDEQIDEVTKLRTSPLIVVGAQDPKGIRRLVEDLPPSFSNILVLGVSPDTAITLERELAGSAQLARLQWVSLQLAELLPELLAPHPPTLGRARNQVLLGSKLVGIDNFLEHENPIDQAFAVVSTEDTAPPRPEENLDELLDQLMGGQGLPWRAFAHGLNWKRADDLVARASAKAKGARTGVTCLNLIVDPGSGATILLQRIAFECARLGFPSLYSRPEARRLDYSTVRDFAEFVREAGPAPSIPFVLLFDVPDAGSVVEDGSAQVPLRLARDGYLALVVRAVQTDPTGTTDQAEVRRRNSISGVSDVSGLTEEWGGPLSATLSPAEIDDVSDWASKHWPALPRDRLSTVLRTWGADWPGESAPPPLLTCLYFLLREEVESVARLGQHLLNRMRATLPESQRSSASSSEKIEDLARRLQEHFKPTRRSRVAAIIDPGRGELGRAFIRLAVLASMRLSVPLSVLSKLSDVRIETIGVVSGMLERAGLASSVFNADQNSGMRARGAYYSEEERVRLRHPGFGRLALEWLISEEGLDDRTFFGIVDEVDEIGASLSENRLPDYPVSLLATVLSQLSPTQSCIVFAEEVSARLLRFQKVRGSPYHEWLFDAWQADTLLAVLDRIPESVASASAVVLHTKGLTRYKSCSKTRPLDSCRERYAAASAEFNRAFDLAIEDFSGEHPGNVVTSHGLLYLNWARQERSRTAEGGSEAAAGKYMSRSVELLREGLRLRPEYNPYAAYGLAAVLIEGCENLDAAARPDMFAERLSEALGLLQQEPDHGALDEWEDLQRRAIVLLNGELAAEAVDRLRDSRSDLASGFAALQTLNGVIPTDPSELPADIARFRKAWQQLGPQREPDTVASPLSDLMRYATYSVLPERMQEPDFRTRLELLGRVRESRYLDDPIWLFDYAFLSFQLGYLDDATKAFSELRRGARYFRVPRSRFRHYASLEDPSKERRVSLRIISASADGKAWARVVEPSRITEPVPVASAKFEESGRTVRAGAVLPGCLIIRATGPMAEPLPSDRRHAR